MVPIESVYGRRFVFALDSKPISIFKMKTWCMSGATFNQESPIFVDIISIVATN
jgi:hypothetical protein